MNFRLAGKWTSVKALQPQNELSLIMSMPSGRLIDVRLSQPVNVLFPMYVRVNGNVIDFSPEQL